jgi:hypothetical protein
VTWFARTAALLIVIGVAGVSVIASQAPAAAKAAGQPTMSVVCSTSPAPVLKVTVVNPSDRDITLQLGFTPGSPQPQVVNAMTVAVIRIATGATEEYVYVNPKYATYAGRKDPWIVPLKAGATFDIELPLRDFISSMNYNSLEPGTAVGGRLILDARAAAKPAGAVWTGKIETPIDACG